MNRVFGFRIYLLLGMIASAIAWLACSEREFMGIIIAWFICCIPIITERLARKAGVRKKSANRGKIAFPTGMLPRLAWTLLAASVAFYLLDGQLGLPFWIAIVVYYQAALAVRTIDQLSELRT